MREEAYNKSYKTKSAITNGQNILWTQNSLTKEYVTSYNIMEHLEKFLIKKKEKSLDKWPKKKAQK